MGKIRIKTLGSEEAEKKQKIEAKKRKEAKEALKESGELKVVSDKEPVLETKENVQEVEQAKAVKESKKKNKKTEEASTKSRKHLANVKLIDKKKTYSLKDALELLGQMRKAGFDETVELHINTNSSGVSGNVSLPHGTGKQLKVITVNPSTVEELVKQIEAGGINFDILIATPDSMPKLAKVARILGPKGLMPNPKNGTVSAKPEEAMKKYLGGEMYFKTEAKFPLLHLSVGKMSFGKEKLTENINAALNAVQTKNIKNATLKSTMSAGIKIQI